jgi:hypothetical protein
LEYFVEVVVPLFSGDESIVVGIDYPEDVEKADFFLN